MIIAGQFGEKITNQLGLNYRTVNKMIKKYKFSGTIEKSIQSVRQKKKTERYNRHFMVM